MGRLITGIIIGLLVGGALVFFVFVGVPRSGNAPGVPIKPPDPNSAAGAAEVVLRQDFFNEVLTAIFRDMNPPAFPVGLARNEASDGNIRPGYAAFEQQPACDGNIRIIQSGSGVNTGIAFENGRITAPLAFTGSYSTMFGCIQFSGWAKAGMELRYDDSRKAVFGNLTVETVNLDGVNPVVSGIVTPVVQSTLNSRVNPIQILSGEQISLSVPVASSGGNLKAVVKDIRAEVKDNALDLYVDYDFAGAPVR